MPEHHEQQPSPHSAAQLFDMVADVAKYPEFLPWCRGARILSREKDGFTAELLISFSHVSESYTSRVTLTPGDVPEIHVALVSGPFESLTNHWKFIPNPKGGATIDFFVEFTFRSAMLTMLIGGMFKRTTQTMVQAFEKRADALYGAGAKG